VSLGVAGDQVSYVSRANGSTNSPSRGAAPESINRRCIVKYHRVTSVWDSGEAVLNPDPAGWPAAGTMTRDARMPYNWVFGIHLSHVALL
jgi:hypothetical protein